MLLAARDMPANVVFASSSSVYGDQETFPLREDMASLLRSPYAASKLAGEAYCRSWWLSFRSTRLHGKAMYVRPRPTCPSRGERSATSPRVDIEEGLRRTVEWFRSVEARKSFGPHHAATSVIAVDADQPAGLLVL